LAAPPLTLPTTGDLYRWKLHGKRGGIVAGTLFVLPSMFVLLALSIVYVQFGTLPWIAAMFSGL